VPRAWNVPAHVQAIREALRFSDPRMDALSRFSELEWEEALRFCDQSHLTTQLGRLCEGRLPPKIAERVASNVANNNIRLARLEDEYRAIAGAFERAGVEWVVLKGFSHWPGMGLQTRSRPQYDIDLLCPPEQTAMARDTLFDLGYRPLAGFENVPLDHLPTMIRPSPWKWRGDLFDVEIPVSIDLHHRFWDPRTERIAVAGAEQFWDRREWGGRADLRFPALAPYDLAGYACLHLLRHLLRGDVKPFHVYDIAWFLHSRSHDEKLWAQWEANHDESLRRLELVIFRLAEVWFECRLPDAVQSRISELPAAIHKWFELYSGAPLENQFHPNKNELWLHLALLQESRDRRAIFWQRVLPARLPPPAEARVDSARLNPRLYGQKLAARAVFHLRVLPPLCLRAIGWRWNSLGLTSGFLSYWAAASMYNLGLFIFFLLYSLYLAQLGYKEDFIGLATSLMTAGALAGSLPAGAFIARLGVKRALVTCAIAVPAICALRAVFDNSALLLVTAFVGGFVSSIWAVIQTPAIAQLTRPDSRTMGFSLIFSSGISLGFLGGLIGGRLPAWIAGHSSHFSVAIGMRVALLIGCAISLLALIPVSRLRLHEPVDRSAKSALALRSVWRILVPAAIWNFALGSVNPFVGLYFTKHLSLPVQDFGTLFGGAKIFSVTGMLLASAYFRRAGIASGVARTQIAAAVALALMAVSPGIWTAIPAYLAFESFAWMYEPGCFGLLANMVAPEQRASASALYFLVVSLASALSAAIAGVAIRRFGYLPVMCLAAVTATIAALCFQLLLRDRVPADPILVHSRS
jgi:predicted MFS family arabinose efflux permease